MELNFLIKKRRQIKAAWVVAAVFALALVCAGSVFYAQWDAAQSGAHVSAPSADKERIERTGLAPARDPLALYQQVTQALGNAEFHTYSYDESSLMVEATFSSDDQATAFGTALQDFRDVASVEPAMQPSDGGVRAVFSVTLTPVLSQGEGREGQ